MSQNHDYPTSPKKFFEKLLCRTRLLLLLFVMTLVSTQLYATKCSAQCNSTSSSTPVTMTDETSSLPSSRQLVNGKNTTVNTAVTGQVSIDASGGGGDVNLTQIGGNTISTGNGTTNSGVQRVTISSDSTGQIAQTASKTISVNNMQSAATGNGDGNPLSTLGYATSLISVTGTFSATVNFEASADGTTNWVPVLGTKAGTTTTSTVATEAGDWIFNVAGFTNIRARVSGFTSGSVTAKGYSTVMSGGAGGGGGGASGNVNINQVAGASANTGYGNAGSGTLRMAIASNPMFFMTSGMVTPPASTQDIFEQKASTSKVVKIQQIILTWDVSSSAGCTVYVRKRDSVDGTNAGDVTVTGYAFDGNGTATSTARAFTTVNSLGNTVGTYAVRNCDGGTGGQGMRDGCYVLFDSKITGQPIVLRQNTNDCMAVNCAGVKPAGTSQKYNVTTYFTEE